VQRVEGPHVMFIEVDRSSVRIENAAGRSIAQRRNRVDHGRSVGLADARQCAQQIALLGDEPAEWKWCGIPIGLELCSA
jgi:hypothetical protein